jgi:hypothetical protein
MTRADLQNELDKMWKEKKAVEQTEEEVDDTFIPAKVAKPFDPETEELVVRIDYENTIKKSPRRFMERGEKNNFK